ncbi:MAG TPA: hypothetical protein VN258_09260 [Mobilitalea sp.]|nr:hypothetical protein [Mobilitalea sp.]
MIIHKIPLKSFLMYGNVSSSISVNEIHMTTNKTINTLFSRTDTPIRSYIYLPDKYKLPFRIDMTVKIDAPAMYLIIGNGHIGIGTDGMDNRSITSIAGEEFKPRKSRANNNIIMGEFAQISAIYGRKAMQLIINGESRYYSTKDPYIKSPLLDTKFRDGFEFKLACDKRTSLTLAAFTITEYEDSEPEFMPESTDELPPPCLSAADKPAIEYCTQGLKPELQQAIFDTDKYLLETLKKSMKFKRKIEGGYPCGKITYVSPFGFSYKLNISGHTMTHSMGWIGYNTKREQEKYGGYKKADYSIATLEKLAETSPEFANEIFFRMKECAGCYGGCMHLSHYEYKGEKKISCGGSIHFKMFPSELADARKVIEAINEIAQADTAV